jgi:hypothetical protein
MWRIFHLNGETSLKKSYSHITSHHHSLFLFLKLELNVFGTQNMFLRYHFNKFNPKQFKEKRHRHRRRKKEKEEEEAIVST